MVWLGLWYAVVPLIAPALVNVVPVLSLFVVHFVADIVVAGVLILASKADIVGFALVVPVIFALDPAVAAAVVVIAVEVVVVLGAVSHR